MWELTVQSFCKQFSGHKLKFTHYKNKLLVYGKQKTTY